MPCESHSCIITFWNRRKLLTPPSEDPVFLQPHDPSHCSRFILLHFVGLNVASFFELAYGWSKHGWTLLAEIRRQKYYENHNSPTARDNEARVPRTELAKTFLEPIRLCVTRFPDSRARIGTTTPTEELIANGNGRASRRRYTHSDWKRHYLQYRWELLRDSPIQRATRISDPNSKRGIYLWRKWEWASQRVNARDGDR